MQRFILYVLAIYLVLLALGLNFFFTGVSLGLFNNQLALFGLVTILPALFLLVYFFRTNISNLEDHEKALHYLIYISLAVDVAMTSVFVVPVLYG